MNIDQKIVLDRFLPRPYQLPIISAIEDKGYKDVLCVLPRRSGKDVVALNILLRAALVKVGIYYYVFPTFNQARLAIWGSLTSDGKKFLDFIPQELILSTNQQQMCIVLKNNSVIQLLGSSDYDRLRGTNASGVVYSEYAYQDPIAAQSISPSVAYNKGFSIYISTPKGKNFMYLQYQIAKQNPKDWFTYLLTIDQTQHISRDQVDDEIRNGKISYDLAQQEYYCSFNRGTDGSFFAKYLNAMHDDGRIGQVPYSNANPVHISWDIGNDATSLIFFQVTGPTINIIDCYENTGAQHGLEHYVRIIKDKPYVIGRCLFPHDMEVTEWGGIRSTRLEKARQLGLNGFIVDKKSIDDGIEMVKSIFSRTWIDINKCAPLIRSLENYQQEYDSKRETYTGKPLHNYASHFCFTGNTMVATDLGDMRIDKIRSGMRVKTPFGYRKVLETHSRVITDSLLEISIGKKKITTTPQHDIFTNRGMVKSDTLRYNDIMEYNSLISGYLWKKIFTFYGTALDSKGFKKSFLSLKMKHKLSLMGTFLDEMASTTSIQPVDLKNIPPLITILKTTLSKISNVFQLKSMVNYIPVGQIVGLNQISAKNCLDLKMKKQKNGIEAQKAKNGTDNTPMNQSEQGKSIKKSVKYAQKNILVNKLGNYSVLALVKQKTGSFINWISWIGLVVSVKVYSTVTNTLLRRHVVKSVQLLSLKLPEQVYDLSIEHDNCYYAEGYLVSNSDSMRYLAVGQSKLGGNSNPDELNKRYQQAQMGNNGSAFSPFNGRL